MVQSLKSKPSRASVMETSEVLTIVVSSVDRKRLIQKLQSVSVCLEAERRIEFTRSSTSVASSLQRIWDLIEPVHQQLIFHQPTHCLRHLIAGLLATNVV